VPDPEDPGTFERSKLTWSTSPENEDMLQWYRKLLEVRKPYLSGGERRADVSYNSGVLTMLVPASRPALRIEATLEPGARLPKLSSTTVTEFLFSEEDGFAVRISARPDEKPQLTVTVV